MTRVLIVEHQSDAGIGLIGERLEAAGGVTTIVVGPDAGRDIPESSAGFDGVIVLGGTPGPMDDEDAPWLPRVRALIADCLRQEVPFLGVCLGAQLLAVVAGGEVGPARKGAELGLHSIELTDAASNDPLLTALPEHAEQFDSLQWHFLEVRSLPPGTESLASSARCANQAFRVGRVAWGLQFHLEALASTAQAWVQHGPGELASLGITADEVVGPMQQHELQLRDTWSRVADRWIAIVVSAAEPAATHA